MRAIKLYTPQNIRKLVDHIPNTIPTIQHVQCARIVALDLSSKGMKHDKHTLAANSVYRYSYYYTSYIHDACMYAIYAYISATVRIYTTFITYVVYTIAAYDDYNECVSREGWKSKIYTCPLKRMDDTKVLKKVEP